MMQEIKFRGKRIDNGKWVYGWYVKRCVGEEGEVIDVIIDEGYFPIEVDPKTVGQFTGLKDKKRTKKYPEGQGIYEEDIVKLAENTYGETVSPINCIVKWNDKGFYQLWRNGMIHWRIWREDAYHNAGYRKDWEVIGSIHENPKLLGD